MKDDMNNLNETSTSGLNRRGFMKSAILAGMGVVAGASSLGAGESKAVSSGNKERLASTVSKKRVLGSDKASMEVSALGFGCMGMTYNRSAPPPGYELSEKKDEAPLMAPILLKEIHLRLLMGPLGKHLRGINTPDTSGNQVSKAISWLRANYKKPLQISGLSTMVKYVACVFS